MSTPAHQTEQWIPDLTTFAARLAVVRQGMGWNSKEAALACGLPATSWRNWEAGKRPHDFAKVCEAIARRTGVPPMWLAFGPERLDGVGTPTSGWSSDSPWIVDTLDAPPALVA
jgi:hypothetical protein